MPNVNLAFEIPEGVIIENAAGLFSGVGIPDFNCPIGSIYLRTDGTRYTKTADGIGSGTWTLEATYAADTTNNGMGAKTIPVGEIKTIHVDYESVILRRAFIYGRLVVNGRLSIIF